MASENVDLTNFLKTGVKRKKIRSKWLHILAADLEVAAEPV